MFTTFYVVCPGIRKIITNTTRHKKSHFLGRSTEALSVCFNTEYYFHMRIAFLISTVVCKLRGEGGGGLRA